MYFGNQRVFHVYHTEYKDTPTQEKNLDITENGEYEVTPDEKLLLSKVIINANVKTPVNLEDKEITDNGTYTASEGYDGIGEVVVNIPEIPKQEKTIEITENGTTEILPDEGKVLTKVTAIANVGGGENKLIPLLNGTSTELTAEDLEGLTTAKQYAFAYNPYLTKIEFPEGLTSLDQRCCYQLTQLKTVIFPSTLKRIEYYAFHGCSTLDAIEFPEGIEYISNNTFGNTSITHITVPSTLTNLGFNTMKQLKTVTISEGITKITNSAFLSDIALESVSIPSTVTEIEDQAFRVCSSLGPTMIISNSVTTIGQTVFQECTSLTSIRIGSGINSISSNCFRDCSNLTDIYIDKPEGSVKGAPWEATNATIHWNTPLPSEEA